MPDFLIKLPLCFVWWQDIIFLSVGVPPVGCQNLCLSVGMWYRGALYAPVLLVATKKTTPEPYWVRRDVNILNKHTILRIVLNLLATKFWWFSI